MKKTRKRMQGTVGMVLAGAVIALSLTSCVAELKVAATDLSEGYARTATDVTAVGDEFQTAMAEFSVNLLQGTITEDDKNDLVSPLSAMLCLGMILNGADGNTGTQLEGALGMDTQSLNQNLYAYTSSLYTAKDCKLGIANSLWCKQDGLFVEESFLQTNADYYAAQVYSAPFDQTTVTDINNWCKYYTDGMIDKILDEIPSETVMYLMNALVFDAEWSVKYENEDVYDHLFTSYDGQSKTLKFLRSTEYAYLSAENAVGFAKNYAGDKYSFVGILPDETMDIYDYVNSLSARAWSALWNSKSSEQTIVGIPEFTYDAQASLNDVLKSLGATDMFDPSAADFSKLGRSEQGNIYCSSVAQKTFIQVDRNGTKAAAVTWGDAAAEGVPDYRYVTLNRPFVYAIVDNATGLPLFLGTVTNL